MKRIVVTKNGPYRIIGGVSLRIKEIVANDEGQSWDWKDGKEFETKSEYNICRCGQSKNMPYCDSSHLNANFNGEETAGDIPFDSQAKNYKGTALTLKDAEKFCAFARFCDPGGKIWNLIGHSDDPKTRELIIREANHCPAGRLVIQETKTGQELEEQLKPSVSVVEDVVLGCSGPLWVEGGIPIESADGQLYETRNRVTLCRCGASGNKPFCNGSHATIKFNDGLISKSK